VSRNTALTVRIPRPCPVGVRARVTIQGWFESPQGQKALATYERHLRLARNGTILKPLRQLEAGEDEPAAQPA
jgi:hypothetical protein